MEKILLISLILHGSCILWSSSIPNKQVYSRENDKERRISIIQSDYG